MNKEAKKALEKYETIEHYLKMKLREVRTLKKILIKRWKK